MCFMYEVSSIGATLNGVCCWLARGLSERSSVVAFVVTCCLLRWIRVVAIFIFLL